MWPRSPRSGPYWRQASKVDHDGRWLYPAAVVEGGPRKSLLKSEWLVWPVAARRAWRMKMEKCPSRPAAVVGTPDSSRTLHFPLQIQKVIKEPAPDSGLLGLFQGQNPLFR